MGNVNNFKIGNTDNIMVEDSQVRNEVENLIPKVDKNITDIATIKVLQASDELKITKNTNDIEKNSENIAEKYNSILYTNYNRIYLDGINGNDNNDGSETHPYKTLDKSLEELNKGKSDLRIYILTSGTYYFSKLELTSVVLHIVATVTGIVISFNNTGNYSVYNSHININCTATDGNIKLYMPNTYDSVPNQVLYFENCVTSLYNVVFDSYYRLDTFGGSIYCNNCVFKGQLVASYGIVHLDTFTSTNTRNDVYAIGLLNGCTCSIRGVLIFTSLTTEGSTSSSNCIRVEYSNLYIGVALKTEISNKYYTGLQVSNSNVIMTDARYNTFTNVALANSGGQTMVKNGVLSL